MNKLSPSGGEGELTETKCGHHFHSSCLATWLKSGINTKCPLCRETLIKPTIMVSYWPPTLIDHLTPTLLRPIFSDFYDRGLLRSNYIEITMNETDGSISVVDMSTGGLIGNIRV